MSSLRIYTMGTSIQIYRDSTKIDGIVRMLFSEITGDYSGIFGIRPWQARADFLSPNCGELLEVDALAKV